MKFIHHLYHESNSLPEFINSIQKTGLEVVYKHGTPSGVKDLDSKVYSFSKIGITPLHLNDLHRKSQLKELHDRLSKLEQARNQNQDKFIER